MSVTRSILTGLLVATSLVAAVYTINHVHCWTVPNTDYTAVACAFF